MIDKFLKDIDLKNYNTLGIGGKTKYYYEPTDKDDLLITLTFIRNINLKYFVLGKGSNIIFPDDNFDGVIINLKKLNNMIIENDILTVESGFYIPTLNNKLIKEGYTNFSWAANLPGTIGGSLIGNAGCYGRDISTDLLSIEILIDDEVKIVSKNDLCFEYRKSDIKGIILSAKFHLYKGDVEKTLEEIKEISEKRLISQPISFKNAGSTFRNPENNYAGKLIEEIGLKGKNIGGAYVSDIHANFIINKDNATSKDVKELINLIKEKVKEKYDINLINENQIVNWDNL